MRLGKISKRYVTTWFAADFCLVGIDWMEKGWSDGLGYARIGKAGRVFRILRLLRLLRLFRIRGRSNLWIAEHIHAEWLIILVDILKIAAFVVGLAHLMACAWFGLGVMDTDLPTWVASQEVDSMTFEHKYVFSLHWALTQFTGGMDEIRPHNVIERTFAVAVYVFSFMAASVFVSNLTSSMTRLHFITNQQTRQFAILRRYLYRNGVSSYLSLRIQRNAQHAFAARQLHMPEHEVELIKFVSEPLLKNLHFELYTPAVSVHPFFARYCQKCPHVMRKVCHSAITTVLVSSGDTLFDAGEIPASPKVYFLNSGAAQYVAISGHVAEVEANVCISEASLWIVWMHMGTLTATCECRFVVLDTKAFQGIVSQFDHPDFDPTDYAEDFVEYLNSRSRGVELTDLPVMGNGFRSTLETVVGARVSTRVSGFANKWINKVNSL